MEKRSVSEKSNGNISSWFCDMEGHAKKRVGRYCELANKTTQQWYRVAAPRMDGHQFGEEEIGSVGEVSKVCTQIVLTCLYLGHIGRPDILWSVNKLARSVTKWTKACDKRLNRLISNIHHTLEYKQYCHVGNTAKQCRLGLFQDSDFAEDLEDSKSTSEGTLCVLGINSDRKELESVGELSQVCTISHEMDQSLWQTPESIDFIYSSYLWIQAILYVGYTAQQSRLGLFQVCEFAGDIEDSKSTSGGILCIFGSHTFVPRSWLCKQQTSVSHSCTEAEVTSLDAGLRMALWDLVIEEFHYSANQTNKTNDVREPLRNLSANTQPNMWKQIPTTHTNLDLTNIDHVPSKGTHSGSYAMLYVFEDSEAVIKMIIQGRSPTMRHVPRTHRVALDWLFDRIHLDSKIQIRYFETKHQLADNLTKCNFTRDEWNHLLTLFNISHFSSTACAAAMAKRAQQESGEERVTAKSRPMMNWTARTPSFVSSSASSNPGRTSYGYQDPGKPAPSDDRAGRPVETSRSNYSQEYGSSWSSQVWKSGAAKHDRSGKPEEISWDTLQKVDPHREEPLLGRNAHSARYEELIHDRTGKPVSVHRQEQAYFENFVMGSDAAEFVNKDLFNIIHCSSICCAENSSLMTCAKTMAKKMQEQKEEIIVAKSKYTAMNLSSHVPTSSSSAKSPIASKSPGILIASGKLESLMRRNSKSVAASSSQVRLWVPRDDVNKIAWDRPKISVGFTIRTWWVWSWGWRRPVWFSSENFLFFSFSWTIPD